MNVFGLRAVGATAACVVLTILAASPVTSVAAPGRGASAEHARIVEYWTPARRADAMPRDLVLDERGNAYLKLPDGRLQAYGRAASGDGAVTPMAKPGGGGGGTGDTTPPSVSAMNPAASATIGAAYTFRATVTDASGLRSVSFSVRKGTARAQSFSASDADGDSVWTVDLSGFTDGSWSWQVVAKDKAGNTTTTPSVAFTVNTSGGGGGSGVVTNSPWTTAGALQNAAGRIYFEMPGNAQRSTWNGYVCSGTVVTDGTSGRSIVVTAAHCVYDDANKAFARNVLFIPNQDQTTSGKTDLNCSNDPLGCWTPSFGVVDVNWTLSTFPNNKAWDYAYYVVNDVGAHTGTATSSDVLDQVASGVGISFVAPTVGSYTHALGYSYSEDPKFMYCAENLGTNGSVNWWLGSCGLTGGSSGGPWIVGMTNGTGDVRSVNSWGYTNQSGMAGPKLNGTSAQCVFGEAKGYAMFTAADGDAGIKVTCP